MSMPKIEYIDSDVIDDPLDNGLDMIDDKSCISQSEEFMISGSEDNLVAYRIVHVPDSPKASHSLNVASSSSSINNAATSNAPQQLQYFVIDNSNGFIQAVSASHLTTVSNAPLKIEQVQTDTAVNTLKMRSSVAIAPKIENIAPYSISSACSSSSSSTNNFCKSTVPSNEALSSLKKNYDKRRATHNEVERRRRDKINHWIMKLGSIIPADGTSTEIVDSGRLSIAAIDGQSKGGILSKACEYVQMLQEKQTKCIENASLSDDSRAAIERKKYEDEIARLRGENELLKAILIKNGINYVKERTTFKSNEYS